MKWKEWIKLSPKQKKAHFESYKKENGQAQQRLTVKAESKTTKA